MEQLLTLFNRFSRLVKEAFQDDPRFLTARDKVTTPAHGGFPWQQQPALTPALSAGLQGRGERRHHLQAGAAHEAERVSAAPPR